MLFWTPACKVFQLERKTSGNPIHLLCNPILSHKILKSGFPKDCRSHKQEAVPLYPAVSLLSASSCSPNSQPVSTFFFFFFLSQNLSFLVNSWNFLLPFLLLSHWETCHTMPMENWPTMHSFLPGAGIILYLRWALLLFQLSASIKNNLIYQQENCYTPLLFIWCNSIQDVFSITSEKRKKIKVEDFNYVLALSKVTMMKRMWKQDMDFWNLLGINWIKTKQKTFYASV